MINHIKSLLGLITSLVLIPGLSYVSSYDVNITPNSIPQEFRSPLATSYELTTDWESHELYNALYGTDIQNLSYEYIRDFLAKVWLENHMYGKNIAPFILWQDCERIIRNYYEITNEPDLLHSIDWCYWIIEQSYSHVKAKMYYIDNRYIYVLLSFSIPYNGDRIVDYVYDTQDSSVKQISDYKEASIVRLRWKTIYYYTQHYRPLLKSMYGIESWKKLDLSKYHINKSNEWVMLTWQSNELIVRSVYTNEVYNLWTFTGNGLSYFQEFFGIFFETNKDHSKFAYVKNITEMPHNDNEVEIYKIDIEYWDLKDNALSFDSTKTMTIYGYMMWIDWTITPSSYFVMDGNYILSYGQITWPYKANRYIFDMSSGEFIEEQNIFKE